MIVLTVLIGLLAVRFLAALAVRPKKRKRYGGSWDDFTIF